MVETKKAIKRSLKRGKVKFKYRDKLDDIIYRTNLFIKNIYDFIALFYVYKKLLNSH